MPNSISPDPINGRKQLWIPILTFLIVGSSYLSVVSLDNTVFWDDEAQTAVIARNFVQSGQLTGWDGRNLYGYRNGSFLDENLRSRNPPLDYLICAASFACLGESTWTARFPFVVTGLLALGVFVLILRNEFPNHPSIWCYSIAVLGLSPVFLLNIRQCRYYSPALLFSLLAYWSYRRILSQNSWRDTIFLSGFAILLFYANYLVAAGFLLALAVLHLAFFANGLSKDCWRKLGTAGCLFLAGTVPYAIWFRIWQRPDIPESSESWMTTKLTLIWWNLRELNLITSMPWVILAGLVVLLVFFSRKLPERRTVLHMLVFALTQVLVLALISPQPTDRTEFADTRFLICVVPLCALLVGVFLAVVHEWNSAAALCFLVALVSCNLLTLHPRNTRFRLLLPSYISEVHHDYPTSYREVVRFVRDEVPANAGILCIPDYTNYPIMYYCGDRVQFSGLLNRQTSLPASSTAELDAPLFREEHFPEWIIAFGLGEEAHRNLKYFSRTHEIDGRKRHFEYRLAKQIDCFFIDTSRPELMQHSFGPVKLFNRETEAIYVYQRFEPKQP